MKRFLALLLSMAAASAVAMADEKNSLIVYTTLFDRQSAELAADDQTVLAVLAELMKGDSTYELRVVAYTDPVDEDKKDEKLAKERAKSVRDFMISKGVPEGNIDIKGVGDEESFGRDDSDTDRALRRRAEVRVRQVGRDKRSIDTELDKDTNTRVQTTIFFDFDKSDIRPAFDRTLTMLGIMLANNPHYNVRLFGHTDGVGAADYNVALGNRRADAVLAKLTGAGATANSVYKVSLGEGETIGAQTMEATTSRALSRSVEIKVLKVDEDETGDVATRADDGKDDKKRDKDHDKKSKKKDKSDD